jgi:hypothetical protein
MPLSGQATDSRHRRIADDSPGELEITCGAAMPGLVNVCRCIGQIDAEVSKLNLQ